MPVQAAVAEQSGPGHAETGDDQPLPAPEAPAPVTAQEEAAPASASLADPPPSAQLEYAVTALREGQNWHGTGRFLWQAQGDRYSISGEASITILFRITVLNFISEGVIHPSGLAPERYSEKPWRKETATTTFDAQNRTISFSASTASYPYQGDEQDRASISWQLASIGRGDAARFTPGAEFEIVVAGSRNADRWRIHVVGLEQVETPHGTFDAWHLHREPRAGGRDQGIDIWLAPQLEWYPVRVRHNYANGEFLDMSLTELTSGAPRQSP